MFSNVNNVTNVNNVFNCYTPTFAPSLSGGGRSASLLLDKLSDSGPFLKKASSRLLMFLVETKCMRRFGGG